jgi:hypothetical protein
MVGLFTPREKCDLCGERAWVVIVLYPADLLGLLVCSPCALIEVEHDPTVEVIRGV